MALADLIRSGVALAKSTLVAGNLAPDVTHAVHDGTFDNNGRPNVTTPGTAYPAIVEYSSRIVRDIDNVEHVSTVRVTFLQYVAVGENDRLTLPDGSTPRILRIDKTVADGDGTPIMTVVSCG